MTDPDYLKAFANRYFSADEGKAVPLDLLRAWLSENHTHSDAHNDVPIVFSMDLDRWAILNAVDL